MPKKYGKNGQNSRKNSLKYNLSYGAKHNTDQPNILVTGISLNAIV